LSTEEIEIIGYDSEYYKEESNEPDYDEDEDQLEARQEEEAREITTINQVDMEQQNQQVQWRRDKVQQLCSKGYSQREISQTLQVGLATVNRDISHLRDQAKTNIRKYIDERLPEEYEKYLVGLTSILKEAWSTSQQTEDKREKIQALSLAKECYSMKLELLTNATVVDDAIRFVSQKSNEKLMSSDNSNEGDKEDSNEPDYDENEDQLEEEHEGKNREITINQVF
jgi:Trp operon repressor